MNDDGAVNLADVAPFVLAMTSRNQYEALFPGVLADVRGDIDSSGLFDVGDIGPFSQMLSASSPAVAVPEPGGLPLALCALLGILLVHVTPPRRVSITSCPVAVFLQRIV